MLASTEPGSVGYYLFLSSALLPITFAQMEMNTGTTERQGCWFGFHFAECSQEGGVGGQEGRAQRWPTFQTLPSLHSKNLWTQGGAGPRAVLPRPTFSAF